MTTTTDTRYLDAAMFNLESCAHVAHVQGHKIVVAKCRRALDLLATENPGYRPDFPHIWRPEDNAHLTKGERHE